MNIADRHINELVFLKEELVNPVIKHAPSSISVFYMTGDNSFQFWGRQQNDTYIGIGSTNSWFQDIESRQVDLFFRKRGRKRACLPPRRS